MPSLHQRDGAVRAWFMAAMGLAAGAGYWWGSIRNDAPADAESSAISAAHRERMRVTPSLTAGELVRKVFACSMDEAQQWRYVRAFTEDEVKVAIADLEKLDRHSMCEWEFQAMLFYRWAELDPLAANAAAKAMFPRGFSHGRQAVIAAWIKQGGAVAAWNAVREEDDTWACTQSVPVEVADMMVASLSDQNDATAFKEVSRLDDDNSLVADVLCRARAVKAIESPESRAAFLAAAASYPDPYVIGCAREWLFRKWSEKDVAAARAGAIALHLSDEDLKSVSYWIDSAERDQARAAEISPSNPP